MRIASVGHVVFAVAMIAIGVLGFVNGGFLAVWNGVPRSLPNREMLAYVCDAVALACGVGLLLKPTATFASRLLFFYLLLWILAFKVPLIFRAPLEEGSYQTNGENAVIVAAAWVLYTWFASEWEKQRLGVFAGDIGLRLARILYGLAMIAFGLSHFVYMNMTAPLVPTWLPGDGEFWGYITGSAYLAAGVAIILGVFARLAAALSTLQMGGITLLVWVPMVASGQIGEFQFGEFVVSCVLTAAAWVVTDSFRGAPLFALRYAQSEKM